MPVVNSVDKECGSVHNGDTRNEVPMWETVRREPKEYVTRESLDRLKAAINRIARSKHSSETPLTCGVCQNLIALEAKGICADENGQTVHADCYVQRVIKNSKPFRSNPRAIKTS